MNNNYDVYMCRGKVNGAFDAARRMENEPNFKDYDYAELNKFKDAGLWLEWKRQQHRDVQKTDAVKIEPTALYQFGSIIDRFAKIVGMPQLRG